MGGSASSHPPRGEQEVETSLSQCEVGGPLSTFAGCKKHLESGRTHHDQFIYVDNFDLTRLPPSMSDVPDQVRQHFVECVKVRAGLVVRMSGGTVSGRPDTWADGTKYLFSEFKGKSMNKVGSGWVWGVKEFVCSHAAGCGQTEDGKHKHRKCWRIQLQTARHVVFDITEAQTSLYDFFDDQVNGDGRVRVSGDGANFDDTKVHTEEDCVVFFIYTHERALARRLEQQYKKCWNMDQELENMMVTHNVDPFKLPVVLISHPHGRMKHISLGRPVEEEGSDEWIKLYDAPTCPGSSGGQVVYYPVMASMLNFYERDAATGKFKRDYKKMVWDTKKQQWVAGQYKFPNWHYMAHPHCGTKPDSAPGSTDMLGYSSSWRLCSN